MIPHGARRKFWFGMLGLSVGAFALAAVPLQAALARDAVLPAIGKDSAVVVDGVSGNVLYERNADSIRYPASLTKIMTLYLLFEALQKGTMTLDTPMAASAHAVAQEPTKLNLGVGDTIPVELAIKAIVIRSANDVAVVIAEALGGTELSFADMMNRKARELGMTQTHFHNASGLPDAQQTTTARDLALLGRHIAYDFPQYYPYFATESFSYKGRYYGTHNNLMGVFAGTDGIKTGYTRASGFNLVTSVVRGNEHLVGVVMGGVTASARDRQMEQMLAETFTRVDSQPTLIAQANVPWQIAGLGPKVNPFRGGGAIQPAQGSSIQLASAIPLPMNAIPQAKPELCASQDSLDKALARDRAAAAKEPAIALADNADEDTAETLTAAVRRTLSQARPIPKPAMQVASYQPLPRPTILREAPKPAAVTAPVASLPTVLEEGDIGGSDMPARTTVRPAAALGLKQWAVQIGAFEDQAAAKAQLTAYAEKSMDVLAQAKRLVVPVPATNGKTLYRARFGLFAENEARQVCKRMTERGQTCFTAVQAN